MVACQASCQPAASAYLMGLCPSCSASKSIPRLLTGKAMEDAQVPGPRHQNETPEEVPTPGFGAAHLQPLGPLGE